MVSIRADERIRKVTSELSAEILRDQVFADSDLTQYRAVPRADAPLNTAWRVRLELTFDSTIVIGLDINGEVTIGRGQDGPAFVAMLTVDEAEQLGVSRQHALLRPTETALYIIDLESTNGTRLNGRSIGVNTPYSLASGDILRLGRLEFTVRIIKRPESMTTHAEHIGMDLNEILPAIARRITSTLELNEVLKQAMEQAMTFTQANEVTVWLVDEQTGELFLEAGRGINKEEHIARIPVSDTLAGRVIKNGKPLRVNRQSGDEQIKLKTGYLVEAVIYIPLTLAGVTFGVLSATNREAGKTFTLHDERVMAAIADLTAVAVHNARQYQATSHMLTRRVKIVTALNSALSHDLKNLAKSTIGYAGLLKSDDALSIESSEIADDLLATGNRMSYLINQLIEITTLNEEGSMRYTPCDLVDTVTRAVNDNLPKADAKQTQINFKQVGEPFLIQGDAPHLYRSALNLIDNAVLYSPPRATVDVLLGFWHNEILIQVRDNGPGIPEEDLPYLFDKFYRASQTGRDHGGIGLGLELVRATVEAHRGIVAARNLEDGGAEFTITLPTTLKFM